MSTTLVDTPTTEAPAEATDRTTWRDVLTGAATGQVVMAAFMVVLGLAFQHEFDPMPVVIGLIVGVGVLLLRKRSGRGGVVYAGVVSLLLFLMVSLIGGFTVFGRPESTFELILFGGLLVVTALGLVATPGAFRRRSTSVVVPRVAGGLIALLVVVGVVAGTLTGSASRMPGDVVLHAKNFEFTSTTLEARAGRVSVWVDNEDVSHHDFTIRDVVSQQLPAQKASRAVFELEAGSYRFYCSLHPDMEGTLRVS